MPFVLDYDSHGNVTGGHFVEQLPERHLQLEPTHDSMDRYSMSHDSSHRWRRGYFPHAQRNANGTQPNPLRVDPPPPGLLSASPTASTALIHTFHQQGLPYESPYASPHFQHHPAPSRQTHFSYSPHLQDRRHQAIEPSHYPHIQPRTHQHQLPSYGQRHSLAEASPPPEEHQYYHEVPPEIPQLDVNFASMSQSDLIISQNEPLQSVAPAPFEEPVDKLAMADEFVSRFAAHFEGDKAALSSFLTACSAYNTKDIDETQLYSEVYRILYIKGSLHLLDGLQQLLPPRWQDVDLTWLNRAIEDDTQKKLGSHDGTDQQVAQVTKPPISKKKRPINGFKTAHDPAVSPTRLPLVKLPFNFHGPAIPQSSESSDLQKMGNIPALNATPVRRGPKQARVVRLPVQMSPAVASSPPAKVKAADAKVKKSRKAEPYEATPDKRAVSFSTHGSSSAATLGTKGKIRYTSMNGTDVVHFGPVFPNRRAVLSRSTKPYIHAACGQGFAHPQDVKTHEYKAKRGAGCHAVGKAWNDHPSCKVDYPQLNYVQVKDGYVILDQKSLDKLEQAIAAGVAHHERSAQSEDQIGDEVDDKGGKMEEESDGDAVEVDDDDDLRAAALGLRKRSRR